DTGTVSGAWRIGPEGLELEWWESGGPPAAERARLGFGLTMVRSRMEAQSRGGVGYDWGPDGLRCTLSIPAAQIAVSPPPAEVVTRKPASDNDKPSLAGMRLLVVEDEPLVS